MTISFRHEATEALRRARELLESQNGDALKYAALELRECLELITYDRATAYEKEIPPEEYKTWQPRKLMSLLLEIDPKADSESSLSIGKQEKEGVPAEEMHFLGSDKALSMKTLKAQYDALGSYLHAPTLSQRATDLSDREKRLRERCTKLVDELDQVLDSPIWNIVFGDVASCECVRCKATVRRRTPSSGEAVHAKCFSCNAGYVVTSINKTQARFEPKQTKATCLYNGCETEFWAWDDQITPGNTLICPNCDGKHRVCYGIKEASDQS